MGSRASPQYQEMRVKRRIEAGNAAGKAKTPKGFFNRGQTESWRSMSTRSQVRTANTCCSGLRFHSPAKF